MAARCVDAMRAVRVAGARSAVTRGGRAIARGMRYDAASRTRMTDRADGSVMFEFNADPPKESVEVTSAPEVVEATSAVTPVVEAPEAEPAAAAEDASESSSTPLSKMKKAELVALCEELGLDAVGTVQELRGRLAPALRAKA